jgi:hypothetical protein
VHAIWALWEPPVQPDHPEAPTAIFHARSLDGGATFTEPVGIAERVPGTLMGLISVAASPSGALLAAWSEGEGQPAVPGANVRSTIRWIRSDDGCTWTAPSPLTELASDVGQGLTAVAATESAWHVLGYEAGPSRTWARIYSAELSDTRFEISRNLASREFGLQDVDLRGDWRLRNAVDIAHVGDYVGLAGSGTTLAAAIVLPQSDDWRSRLICLAAVLGESLDGSIERGAC